MVPEGPRRRIRQSVESSPLAICVVTALTAVAPLTSKISSEGSDGLDAPVAVFSMSADLVGLV